MNRDSLTTETIGVALVVAIVALVVVTLVSGASALPVTGLKDLVILLGGGLLGSKIPH